MFVFVIAYHYICYSVSNSYWARSMYAVTIKPMCSMINAVLYLIRNLRAIVCLPENITFLSTRNRATMPSLGKIEEFNSATTGINRYLERLEQYFVADSISADSAESHKRRAILISVIGAEAFWENVCTAHHYPKESFRTEETGYRRKIPIPQLYTTRRRECHSVGC